MALLFDSLLLPDSDFGLDHVSPLEWRYEPKHAIPHLVLGKGPPGGAWHVRNPKQYCQSFLGRRAKPAPLLAYSIYQISFVMLIGVVFFDFSGYGGLHANSEPG